MDKVLKPIEVHLGCQGRLVIPASFRQKLQLEEGDKLIAREEKGRIILEKRSTIKQRLKARFHQVSQQRSLADELIAERHEAAIEEATTQ